MGYSIEPLFELKLDDVDFLETLNQDEIFEKEIGEIFQKLKSKKLNIPKIKSNPVFFSSLEFYCNNNNLKFLEFDAIEGYFTDEDSSIPNCIEVLEILIFLIELSKKNPSSNITFGIGDMDYFWVDLTILNGKLIDYKTYGTDKNGNEIENPNVNDLQEFDGFICSKEEIVEFFNTIEI
jgi:hypothetical protein